KTRTARPTADGCVRGSWWSSEFGVPVSLPGVPVQGAAPRRHPVHPADRPPRPRLLEPPADHLLARPLHQAAADRLPQSQPPRVAEVFALPAEVAPQPVQRLPPAGRPHLAAAL